jgi:nucleoid-associated protein YgaU
MGFSVGDVFSGIRTTVEGVVDKGKAFENALANAGKQGVDKVLDVAVPVAGTVTKKIYDDIPPPVVNAALSGVEKGVDAGASIVQHIPSAPQGVKKLAGDLAQVDLHQITDNTGADGKPLEADWGALTYDWFFEKKPAALGNWDTITKDGQTFSRCTFTDLSYARDLSKLDNQKAAKNLLFGDGGPYVGKEVNIQWQYTGQGTREGGLQFGLLNKDGRRIGVTDDTTRATDATPAQVDGHYTSQGGHYGTLESFMGSYDTNAKVVDVDKDGNATVRFTVVNDSDWQSGTRVNPSGIKAGLPPYLIPNQAPDKGAHLGGNFEQVYTWEQKFDKNGNPTGDPITLPQAHQSPTSEAGGAKPPEGGGETTGPSNADTPAPSQPGATGRTDPSLQAQGYQGAVVRPGDTIWDIAKRNGVDFSKTVELNKAHIADPDLIYPGDVIYLPSQDVAQHKPNPRIFARES